MGKSTDPVDRRHHQQPPPHQQPTPYQQEIGMNSIQSSQFQSVYHVGSGNQQQSSHIHQQTGVSSGTTAQSLNHPYNTALHSQQHQQQSMRIVAAPSPVPTSNNNMHPQTLPLHLHSHQFVTMDPSVATLPSSIVAHLSKAIIPEGYEIPTSQQRLDIRWAYCWFRSLNHVPNKMRYNAKCIFCGYELEGRPLRLQAHISNQCKRVPDDIKAIYLRDVEKFSPKVKPTFPNVTSASLPMIVHNGGVNGSLEVNGSQPQQSLPTLIVPQNNSSGGSSQQHMYQQQQQQQSSHQSQGQQMQEETDTSSHHHPSMPISSPQQMNTMELLSQQHQGQESYHHGSQSREVRVLHMDNEEVIAEEDRARIRSILEATNDHDQDHDHDTEHHDPSDPSSTHLLATFPTNQRNFMQHDTAFMNHSHHFPQAHSSSPEPPMHLSRSSNSNRYDLHLPSHQYAPNSAALESSLEKLLSNDEQVRKRSRTETNTMKFTQTKLISSSTKRTRKLLYVGKRSWDEFVLNICISPQPVPIDSISSTGTYLKSSEYSKWREMEEFVQTFYDSDFKISSLSVSSSSNESTLNRYFQESKEIVVRNYILSGSREKEWIATLVPVNNTEKDSKVFALFLQHRSETSESYFISWISLSPRDQSVSIKLKIFDSMRSFLGISQIDVEKLLLGIQCPDRMMRDASIGSDLYIPCIWSHLDTIFQSHLRHIILPHLISSSVLAKSPLQVLEEIMTILTSYPALFRIVMKERSVDQYQQWSLTFYEFLDTACYCCQNIISFDDSVIADSMQEETIVFDELKTLLRNVADTSRSDMTPILNLSQLNTRLNALRPLVEVMKTIAKNRTQLSIGEGYQILLQLFGKYRKKALEAALPFEKDLYRDLLQSVHELLQTLPSQSDHYAIAILLDPLLLSNSGVLSSLEVDKTVSTMIRLFSQTASHDSLTNSLIQYLSNGERINSNEHDRNAVEYWQNCAALKDDEEVALLPQIAIAALSMPCTTTSAQTDAKVLFTGNGSVGSQDEEAKLSFLRYLNIVMKRQRQGNPTDCSEVNDVSNVANIHTWVNKTCIEMKDWIRWEQLKEKFAMKGMQEYNVSGSAVNTDIQRKLFELDIDKLVCS